MSAAQQPSVTPDDIELAQRIVRDFRQQGWPAKEEEIARLLSRRREARSADLRAENERLRSAAQNLMDRKFATYKARNGRDVGIQGDDGEMCWIVHSDDIFTLEAALSTQPKTEEIQ